MKQLRFKGHETEGNKNDSFVMFQKGFSLVELLIALLATGIIMGAVLGLMSLFLSHFEFTSAGATARQRAEMVFTVLDEPIDHVGLGMPIASSDFQAAFNDLYDTQITAEDYPAPLHIVSGDSELHIVYGDPTGLSVIGPEDMDTDTIELNGSPDGIDIYSDWVVFPTGEQPFKVKSKGLDSLELDNSDALQDVALLDEVHLVRFLRIYVDPEGFHAEDPRSGGKEICIEGIRSLEFEYFDDMNILAVTVEAQGKEGRREDTEKVTFAWRMRNL